MDGRTYVKNLAQYYLVVVGCIFATGFFKDETNNGLTYREAFEMAGLFAIVCLGHMLASKFAKSK